MPDQKTQLVTFPLTLGMNDAAWEDAVQPLGDRPQLIASYNTRLSKKNGVATKAPGTTPLLTSAARCGGIIPSGAYDSTVAFFHPGGFGAGNQRITGSDFVKLKALNGADAQNSYYPAQVSGAGVLPDGASSFQNPAVCHDLAGYTYFATYRVVGADTAVYVTVIDDDGRLVVPPVLALPTFFANTMGDGSFVALTAHAPGVVLLWYRDGNIGPAATTIKVCPLSISGATLVVGASSTIYTPISARPRSIAVTCDPNDTANAYLICFDAASHDARLIRVDVATRAVVVAFGVVTGADANAFHAISYVHDGTSGYLIWMVSWAAGNCSVFRANTGPLSTVWSATNRMWNGSAVGCSFYRANGFHYAVFSSCADGSVTTTATPAGIKHEFRDVATGALSWSSDHPWYQLIAQPATLKVQNTEYYPLLAVQGVWDTARSYNPLQPGFLSDPSIEMVRPGFSDMVIWTPVARLGSDICARYIDYNVGGCNSLIASGTNVWLAYKAENLAEGMITMEWASRFAKLDFGQVRPRFVLSKDGTAIIAGAMPATWDGAELAEFSPLKAPKIFGTVAGGAGTNLTGTYLFACVVSWRDGQGKLHRSAPSNVITLAPAAQKVALYVAAPFSMRNGNTQRALKIQIYASEAGGTILYAQPYAETTVSSTNFWKAFLLIDTPVIDASHVPLYSTGSATDMVLPFCPNACSDVCVIGDRLWMLDAERARAYYSQPVTTEALDGVFYAMSPTQYVDFPASAGAPVALSQWMGRPLFFTAYGIWTVDGQGPDALNSPPFFSLPTQVSQLNCTDRGSVVSSPSGVLFATGKRFAVYDGESRIFDQIDVSNPVAGTAIFRDQQEVVLVSTAGYMHVFNYVEQKWSKWLYDAVNGGGDITCAAQIPGANLLYFSRSLSQVISMDPDTVSTTAQMLLKTGWILLGGPQDDNMLVSVILHALRVGAHGVTLTIATDYAATQPSKVFAAGDVTTNASNLRYDLWTEPRDQVARAVQVTIQETGATGEAMMPENLTLEVIKNPGKRASSLKQSGRK